MGAIKGSEQNQSEKRGVSLPNTSSKPTMPPVKPPKKEDGK